MGKLHCSVVHAMCNTGHTGRANHFLSWSWQYRLSTVLSGLECWVSIQKTLNSQFDPKKTFLWWCFFCENQIRIVEEGRQKRSFERQASTFRHVIEKCGSMILLMDHIKQGSYSSRSWCAYEMHVAICAEVSTDVAFPAKELDDLASLNANNPLSCSTLVDFTKLETSTAHSFWTDDDIAVNDLIEQEGGSLSIIKKRIQSTVLQKLIERIVRKQFTIHSSPVVIGKC